MGADRTSPGRQLPLTGDAVADSDNCSPSGKDIRIAQLWRRYFEQKSVVNRNALFNIYTELAKRIALGLYKRYAYFGVCADDFIQNAYLGLYQSIDRFQDNRDAKFETFAAYRIKGAVLNGLRHYSEAFDLYQHRKLLESERIDAILTARGKSQDVQTLLSVALDVVTSSIVELVELESQNSDSDIADKDISSFSNSISHMVSRLPGQYQQIVMMHYFYEQSFGDIAAALGKSKSAVFKMHTKALEIVRDLMSASERELMTI